MDDNTSCFRGTVLHIMHMVMLLTRGGVVATVSPRSSRLLSVMEDELWRNERILLDISEYVAALSEPMERYLADIHHAALRLRTCG